MAICYTERWGRKGVGPPVSESGGHGARATCHPDVIAFFFFCWFWWCVDPVVIRLSESKSTEGMQQVNRQN